MMTGVRAHEDERCRTGCGPCEPAEMALCVAGGIEQVEGSIAKEIEGVEAANFQRIIGREADFSHFSTEDIAIEHASFLVGWPPWP